MNNYPKDDPNSIMQGSPNCCDNLDAYYDSQFVDSEQLCKSKVNEFEITYEQMSYTPVLPGSVFCRILEVTLDCDEVLQTFTIDQNGVFKFKDVQSNPRYYVCEELSKINLATGEITLFWNDVSMVHYLSCSYEYNLPT